MNAGQIRLYRFEVAEWVKACRKLNRPCDDEARRALHKSVGAPDSSKDFTQDDLTKVIGKLRSFSQPGNFAAQMHVLEDAGQRLDDLKNRCTDAANAILRPKIKDMGHLHSAAGKYIDSTAYNLFKTHGELTERQWQKLCGVLEASARRVEARHKDAARASAPHDPKPAFPVDGTPDEDGPF